MKNKKVLREFRSNTQPSLPSLVSLFSRQGAMSRVGGNKRIYTIDNSNQKGAIYIVGSSTSAIGFGWTNSSAEIETIYFWKDFSFNDSPDYCVDVPEGDVTLMVPKILEMMKNYTIGKVDL